MAAAAEDSAEAVAAAQETAQRAAKQQSAEYGEPPDPEAEIEMQGGKAFWVWVTDSGEEKSVVRI